MTPLEPIVLLIVVPVLAAVVFFILFLRETLRLRVCRIKLSEREREAEELRALTPDLACEALLGMGFDPVTNGGALLIGVKGGRCAVTTDRIPFVRVEKCWSLDGSGYDLDAMAEVARMVSEGIVLGKAFVNRSERTLSLHVYGYENRCGHFREALPVYLDIIDEMDRRIRVAYRDLDAQKNLWGAASDGEASTASRGTPS